MMVPLNTNARVTVLKNHEGGHAVFRTRPNIRLQVTPLARPVSRGVVHAGSVPSAVAFTHVASGAPEASRWAAESRRSSFHGGANQN